MSTWHPGRQEDAHELLFAIFTKLQATAVNEIIQFEGTTTGTETCSVVLARLALHN